VEHDADAADHPEGDKANVDNDHRAPRREDGVAVDKADHASVLVARLALVDLGLCPEVVAARKVGPTKGGEEEVRDEDQGVAGVYPIGLVGGREGRVHQPHDVVGHAHQCGNHDERPHASLDRVLVSPRQEPEEADQLRVCPDQSRRTRASLLYLEGRFDRQDREDDGHTRTPARLIRNN